MAIEFPCTSCGQTVQTPDTYAGKKGKCPHCSAIVQIPGGSPAAEKPKPAPQAKPQQKKTPPPQPAPGKPPAGNIEFPCPDCKKEVSTPASFGGKKGRCPHCQAIIQIPKPSTGKTQPKPKTAPAQKKTQPAQQKQPVAKKTPAAAKLKFNCGQCKKEVTCPAAMAGKKGQCPHCKAKMIIPSPRQRPKQTAGGAAGLTPMAGGGLQPLGDAGGLQPLDGGGLQPLDGGGLQPLAGGGLQPLDGGGLQPLDGGGLQPLDGGGLQPLDGGGLQPLDGGGLQPLDGGGLQPLDGGGLQPLGGGLNSLSGPVLGGPAVGGPTLGSNPYHAPARTQKKKKSRSRGGSSGSVSGPVYGFGVTLAVFDFLAAALFIVMSLIAFVMFLVLASAASAQEGNSDAAMGLLVGGGVVGIISCFFLIGFSVFLIFRGVGLIKKLAWAYYASIVIGCLDGLNVAYNIVSLFGKMSIMGPAEWAGAFIGIAISIFFTALNLGVGIGYIKSNS